MQLLFLFLPLVHAVLLTTFVFLLIVIRLPADPLRDPLLALPLQLLSLSLPKGRPPLRDPLATCLVGGSIYLPVRSLQYRRIPRRMHHVLPRGSSNPRVLGKAHGLFRQRKADQASGRWSSRVLKPTATISAVTPPFEEIVAHLRSCV